MYTNKSFLPKKDLPTVDLPDCPLDSISSIAFNLENTHMAVSSWDGTVKLYKIPYYGNPGANFTIEKSFNLQKPVLSCCFFNGMLLAGLVDGSLVGVEANQTIKAHDNSIKALKNFNNQFLVSGSFDGTLKFWDLKSSNPIHSINLPGKVYAMDLKGSFLVVALDDKTILAYDMSNPTQPAVFPTRLTHSIRSVCCHKDLDTFAVGGIEAKIEIFSRTIPSKKTIFRSHRIENKLYSVNAIAFSPNDPNIFVSGGADGSLVWLDKLNRNKLCTAEYNVPITAGEFSNDGKYFVFALGDDWSKGYTGQPVKVSLKMVVTNQVPGYMNK